MCVRLLRIVVDPEDNIDHHSLLEFDITKLSNSQSSRHGPTPLLVQLLVQ